jgi:aspartate carbamoyltransferase catalytic subunit
VNDLKWAHRHLLGISDLSKEEIFYLLEKANDFRNFLEKSPKRLANLKGYFLVNLFFEPSTRTRVSFEIAAKLLGMEVINFSTSLSSVQKGENLRDTVLTLSQMKVDILVVRHRESGLPLYFAGFLPFHIVNAGDGIREHPTQALLDLLTIKRQFGKVSGLRVAIVGDITHSRVARSLCVGLVKLGNSVVVSGPTTLVPRSIEEVGAEIVFPVEQAVQDVDIVYLLRIQRERQEAGYFPSLKEYSIFYGFDSKVMQLIRNSFVLMHPGPVNRGVEIASELVEAPFSLIQEQVTCGLAVRMAVLDTLIGSD